MAEIFTTRLTDELERGLVLVAKLEHIDKSTALRRLLSGSLQQWKRERAIKKYQSGDFSAEQAARFANMNLWSFFYMLKQKKIAITYDEEELERDLQTLAWKKQ